MTELPFSVKRAVPPFQIQIMKDHYEDKAYWLLTQLVLHFFAWKCILERKNLEALVTIRQMLKLSVLEENNWNLTINLLEH